MKNKKYKSLDLSILNKKKSATISSKDALKDVISIDWNKDISPGKEKNHSEQTI